jgi:mannonate dehydratase
MNMTWRWFGHGNDNVKLTDIRQIPGVSGIVWSLHDKVAGDVWPMEEIRRVTDDIKAHGFHAEVVESVNIHDDIKIGLPSRDHYIDIYIDTIRKLSEVGVKVICYNFMPVFDWLRTDFYRELPDTSNAMYYEKALVDVDIEELARRILGKADSFTLPGWEPERLARIKDLMAAYKDVTEEKTRGKPQVFSGAHHAHLRGLRCPDGHPPGRSAMAHVRAAPHHSQPGAYTEVPATGGQPVQRADPVHGLARRVRGQ